MDISGRASRPCQLTAAITCDPTVAGSQQDQNILNHAAQLNPFLEQISQVRTRTPKYAVLAINQTPRHPQLTEETLKAVHRPCLAPNRSYRTSRTKTSSPPSSSSSSLPLALLLRKRLVSIRNAYVLPNAGLPSADSKILTLLPLLWSLFSRLSKLLPISAEGFVPTAELRRRVQRWWVWVRWRRERMKVVRRAWPGVLLS